MDLISVQLLFNLFLTLTLGANVINKLQPSYQCDQIKIAKGFKKLPKVQKIANSGHTSSYPRLVKNSPEVTTMLHLILLLLEMSVYYLCLPIDQGIHKHASGYSDPTHITTWKCKSTSIPIVHSSYIKFQTMNL